MTCLESAGVLTPATVCRNCTCASSAHNVGREPAPNALGVVTRTADGLALARDHLDQVVGSWVADSPLHAVVATHPRLAAFVQWGRITRMPIEPALVEELYTALAELFDSGETLAEVDVNARIAAVHDDPAEVRRALVDRGLLHRTPGTAVYRRP